EDHFGSDSLLQRNERIKLAASFWNNVGAGMVIGGMAAAFFLDKPQGTWMKNGIAIAGACASLGLLLNGQQYFDLYAHSGRRAPLEQVAAFPESYRVRLCAALSRDAKFGPLVCSPGSRKSTLPAQPDVTLARFDIGRTRAATRRPMSPLRSTASNRRLIDMA